MNAVEISDTDRPDPSVTDAIRAAIVSGEFAPNQRLIEADLTGSLGASRTSIRSALFELATEGLVDRLPNRGARVRSVSLDEAVEILEVRIAVEGLCAAKAAERITDGEVDELRLLRAALIESVSAGDLLEYSRLHQNLDRRIREISAQATAVGIIERLRAQSVRHQFRLSFQAGRARVSVNEHVAIIDALIDRDPVAAQAATREHLMSVIEALRSLT
ncbi:MAG: GntR family transcriptional regulator [Pseudolysinimonas sp.]|uniref:GntR family transcriptional regulator n=1 Tax=Pseudolysinimonas sp. TaxID=2680009 RepID=UPI00326762CE